MTTKRSILALAAILWPSVSLGDQVLSGDHIQFTTAVTAPGTVLLTVAFVFREWCLAGHVLSRLPWQHFALFDHGGSAYSYAQNYSSAAGRYEHQLRGGSIRQHHQDFLA